MPIHHSRIWRRVRLIFLINLFPAYEKYDEKRTVEDNPMKEEMLFLLPIKKSNK